MSQSSLSATVCSSIYQHLEQWIALRLKFKDPETPENIASRRTLWLALPVVREVADVLAEDLRLEFARGAYTSVLVDWDKTRDQLREREREERHTRFRYNRAASEIWLD